MIELLISMAILALLLAILVPNFLNQKANADLKLAAQNFAEDLKYAREIGISTGSAVIDFTKYPAGSSSGYEIQNSEGALLKAAGLQNITITTPSGITSVTFNSKGSADNGGDFTLTASKTGKNYVINLTLLGGRVKLR